MLTYNIHIKKVNLKGVNVLKLCCDRRRHKEPVLEWGCFTWTFV
jgi:hypothetical protein